MKSCRGFCIYFAIAAAGLFFGRGISWNRTKSELHSQSYVVDVQNPRISVETRVAVIIRVHLPYVRSLFNLLWCLEAQQSSFEIYALILPTEHSSIKPLKKRLMLEWKNSNNGLKKKVTAQILELPERYYVDNCCLLDKICTREWRERLLKGGYPPGHLDRHCTINSPLHYTLVDNALDMITSSCSQCIGLFVTNADNSYAPTFIQRTVPYLSSYSSMDEFRTKNDTMYEMVLVDMVYYGKAFSVAPKRAQMDLGCVMISFKFFNATRTRFLSSLPVPAEPQDYHDADYWIMHHLLNVGARVQIVHELLFSHY